MSLIQKDYVLTLDGVTYCVAEHPAAPGMPYGQEGRQATVYQLFAGSERRALKVFKPRFRDPALVSLAERLVAFANLTGLQVCRRIVLTRERNPRLDPDLLYAVLMPWIEGETWQGVMLAGQPLTRDASRALAARFAAILAALEQRGIAHCDLSAPNLILSTIQPPISNLQSPPTNLQLVDVEGLFAPGLTQPQTLPAGSPGYAHKTAPQGLWSADADRFAGAVLIAEMLGWCDTRVRQIAWGEQYFDPSEMQANTERYQLLYASLKQTWDSALAELFARAWFSETLAACPAFGDWATALGVKPAEEIMPQATPPPMFEPEENLQARLARAKIESGEVFLALGNAEESVTELGKAYALYPSLAANAYARALLARGEQRERAQNWDAALADYRQALQVAPDGSSLQSEIAAIVRQAEAQQAQRAREKEKPHCSKCGEEVQRGRTLCPHCGQSLKTQESSPQPSLPEQATLHRLKWVLALACTVVGLLAVIGAGIWLVYYQDQQNQRAALERKITQLVSDSVKSLEESKRLERTDKTAARDAAQYALKLAEDARALNPQDPRVSNAYYAAQDALNALSGVSVIFTLPSFATFTDPKSQITRIVAHWPDLFILDRGLQRVYRYVINDVGSNATPTTGDGIILKYGDRIENRTVGELFDIVWLDAGRLAALDRNGAYYQYDPARAAWSARLVNDPAAWSRATLAETYANNLYLVDAPRNQILKYVTPSAGVAWSAAVTYFVPDITPPDLSTAVDLAIDGDAWIARSDGSVSRYNQGRPNDLALAGLDAPISRPSAIVTSEKMSNLYIADAGNQRIVQFDKTTGRFTRQFKPRGQERDAFKALQALAVDEANKRFFFVSEGKAYIATIPQDDSFYSRTPLVATPVPAEQRRGNDNAWMVYVPNGEFPMGASSSDSQASDNEKPQHTVYLDSFWIDKYEVINALYKRCVDAGKCSAPSDRSSYTRSSYYGNSWFDNYPVIYVSWNDASTYCAWAGKRLPTEAEWEKAARGTDGRVYPWGNTFEGAKVNSSDSNPRPGDTIEVGKYPNGASPYGALDMAGNVWEWVADWYGDNYYSISPRNNPKGPSSGPSRVLRGGSGYVNQSYVRASFRGINTPDYRYYSTGFRCAQ